MKGRRMGYRLWRRIVGATFVWAVGMSAAMALSCPPTGPVLIEEDWPDKDAVRSGVAAFYTGWIRGYVAPDEAVWLGELRVSPTGALEQRREMAWLNEARAAWKADNIAGRAEVVIFDAYRFDGRVLRDGEVIEVTDVPVDLWHSCQSEYDGICASVPPVARSVVFGGFLYGADQGGRYEAELCPTYLWQGSFKWDLTVEELIALFLKVR